MTADEVAEVALRGLERGELIIIPQADGRWLWRLKRVAPGLQGWLVLRVYGAGWIDRLMGVG